MAVLDRYREAEESTVSKLEAGAPTEAIKAVFEGIIEGLAGEKEPRRGCLLANCEVEHAPHDLAVGARVSRYVARMEDAFERTVRRGRAGHPPCPQDPGTHLG